MAFRRTAGSSSAPGTRAGLRSQTLVSSGHPDLDRILGGGLPLGTVLCILEDAHSPHHNTLLKLFVAEGVVCGHQVLWASAGAASGRNGISELPQLLEASIQPQEAVGSDKTDAGLRIAWQYRKYIQDKPAAPQRKPTNAESSTPLPPSSAARRKGPEPKDWCHRFDLSRPMKDPGEQNHHLERRFYSGDSAAAKVVEAASELKARISSADSALPRGGILDHQPPRVPAAGASALSSAVGQDSRPVRRLMASMSRRESPEQSASEAPAQNPQLAPPEPALRAMRLSHPGDSASSQQGKAQAASQRPSHLLETPAASVGRLALETLGSHRWGFEVGTKQAEADLLRQLQRLKAVARGSQLAVMVSIPSELYGASLSSRLQHLCDASVVLEAVREDSEILSLIPDPGSCCGVLRVRKLPEGQTIAPPLPGETSYLVRNKHRRISLEPFEVDPDAEAGGSGGGAAPSGAAAVMCGGPPSAGTAFDF